MKRQGFTPLFTKKPRCVDAPALKLEDGSRVAVMGGGPSGSFFSYFLLDMARRVGMDVSVDIYEPRDFSLPAPQGCNMCAGVISESLVQNLAAEGINLPPTVVQRAIDSYIMHTDVGSLKINAPYHEKRIGAMFRGAGPRDIRESKWNSFDGHLLSLAKNMGAIVINTRIIDVDPFDGQLLIKTRTDSGRIYDLLAVVSGVNSAALKRFEGGDFNYKPPRTTKTALREYYIGAENIEKFLGSSLHVFLLDIPRLDFAMIIPKGDYVTVCLLGTDIDEALLRTFLNAPQVTQCFPPDWNWDQPSCQCFPRINIQGAIQPYTDRIVFIGDSGVSRLYKDGIGAAYRASKAAAATAIFEGISANDFNKYYWPACRAMHVDNQFGRIIFTVTRIVQRIRFFRQAVVNMAAREQRKSTPPRMSSVLWDTFTGSAPYKDIFVRTLHPAFLGRLSGDLVNSLAENYFSAKPD